MVLICGTLSSWAGTKAAQIHSNLFFFILFLKSFNSFPTHAHMCLHLHTCSEVFCSYFKRYVIIFFISLNQLLTHLEWCLIHLFINSILLLYTMPQQIICLLLCKYIISLLTKVAKAKYGPLLFVTGCGTQIGGYPSGGLLCLDMYRLHAGVLVVLYCCLLPQRSPWSIL